MKKIFTGLFLICTLSASSQKYNTKMVVEVSDTANIIARVLDVLNEDGYTVDQQTDKFISTKEKPVHNANLPPTEMKLKAFYKDGRLTFSGDFKVNLKLFDQPPSFLEISNRGAKKSAFRVTWAEMEKIARQFGPVTYAK